MGKLTASTLILATIAAGSPALADSAPQPPAPAPSPQPQPAPPNRLAPPPVGPFIVFFESNKSDIDPVAAAILDNVAAAYRSADSMQLMLAGNSDTSGTAARNQRLAQRRAENVKAYLAGRGVPDAAMSITAYGETKPLAETGDGVREAQNRNVQIFFGPGRPQ